MSRPLRTLCAVLALSLLSVHAQQQEQQKPESDKAPPAAEERVKNDHSTSHAKRVVEEKEFTPEQREVYDASERLRQAILNRDADQLRLLMAMNYQLIGSMGRAMDRTDSINAIAFQITSFDVVDIDTQSIKVEGHAASETGTAYIRGTYRGELFSMSYRFVRHWQREEGQWKLVSTNIQGLGGVF